jgi:hypothetical protein
VFTDGSALRRTHVEASSLAEASARASNIARGMMEQHEPGTQNWSAWQITIETPDEGRCNDPFPDPLSSRDLNVRRLEGAPNDTTGLTKTPKRCSVGDEDAPRMIRCVLDTRKQFK